MHGRMIGSRILLFAMVLAGTGCSKEKSGISVNVTQKNLCGEVAEVMCHNVFKCCTGGEIEQFFGVEITTSEEKCRRDMTLVCEKENAALIDALGRKTASLKEDKADACLQALLVTDDGCFPVLADFAPECAESPVLGMVANGGACLYSFECGVDSYCATNRTCAPKSTLGGTCAQDSECATGLYCSPVALNAGGACASRVAAGGGCAYSPFNANNINTRQCAEDLLCVESNGAPAADGGVDTGSNGTCSAKKGLGEVCDSHEICASGYCLALESCAGACAYTDQPCQTADGCENTYCANAAFQTACNGNEECSACAGSGNRCTEDADCPGTCATSGDTCYDDPDCNDSADGGNACESDSCAPGLCAPEECIPTGECLGTPVCAESYVTANFCDPILYRRAVDPASAVN